MPRRSWDELPRTVRRAVREQVGPVVHTEPATAGALSEIAMTLHLDHGEKIFCKGVPVDHPQAWMHRNEITLNPHLADLAPRLLWHLETSGWLLLAFTHVSGRPADLSPESSDLRLLAALLGHMTRRLTPAPGRWRALADRWAAAPGWRALAENTPDDLAPWIRDNLYPLVGWDDAAPELLSGDTLLHTDLTADNLLISRRPYVVDWAWPACGPAWADIAFLVIRLIHAGHTPAQAEAWAASVPAWQTAPATAITAFAVTLAGRREQRRRTHPAPHHALLAAATRRWTRTRLSGGDGQVFGGVQS